jgi:hypothetical protein
LHITGPLNRIDPARVQEATGRWGPRLAHLPRPFTALIVGGSSSSYELDARTATRLAQEASARAKPGSLLVSTSPRTPDAATDALFAAIEGPSHLYRWRRDDPENPYFALLALADRFIVTVDSASLAIEACSTRKPVEVFEWPRRDGRTMPNEPSEPGVMTRLRTSATDALIYLGLIKPARDFDAFHRVLRERGLTTRLGHSGVERPRRSLDDLEQTVARVRQLFAGEYHSRRMR